MICKPILASVFAAMSFSAVFSEASLAKEGPPAHAASKEFTTGCVAFPLPATPTGPTYTGFYQRNNQTADFVVWRAPCGPARAEAQTLVRITPRTGTPFVCAPTIIQNGIQYEPSAMRRSPAAGDSLCSEVLVPVTVYIPATTASGVAFDDDAAFTLIYPASGSTSAGLRIEVPAYDPALYGVAPPAFSIRPSMSGGWNTAGVSSQGFYFDISEANRIFAAAWFTGTPNGLSLDWYSALGNYSGDSVNATLFRSTGVGFAQGSTAITAAFGTIRFEFESCTSGVVTWQMNDGRTGSLPIRKLVPPPTPC